MAENEKKKKAIIELNEDDAVIVAHALPYLAAKVAEVPGWVMKTVTDKEIEDLYQRVVKALK